ncbi:hypothetical protein Q3G72_027292 [Acer saccharum]|nr:hypothetical protein Q3G72_027292 [Acer saccharum]
MAGTLPGVGVPHRRRTQHQYYRQENALGNSGISLRERRDPSSIMAMDETALRARLRLEQRLAFLYSSPRPSDHQLDQGGGNGHKHKAAARVKGTRSGPKNILGMPWNFQLNRCKSVKTCSVCLEDLQDQQRVMNLKCSHKYHSHCLLPWLVSHSSCPNCRTLVQY